MLTTTQVRFIMNAYKQKTIYTNKTWGDKSENRRVKCYAGDKALLKVLRTAAGTENVTVTNGLYNGPGIVVKCILG